MKNSVRRITAMFLAVSLMAASGSLDYKTPYVYAEEGTEAVAASDEAAPAPETQAPTEAPQPETQPPTEAPQPETQPPTEAPAPETQPPTEVPQTDAQPQETPQQPAESEKKQTELVEEPEEVKMTRTVTGKKGSGVFTIKLPKDKKVPETATLTIEATKRKNDQKNLSKIEGFLNHRAQEFSGGRFYTLHLYDGAEELRIPKGTNVDYSNDEGRTIGIEPYRQSEVHILDISGASASEISAETSLSSDGMAVKKASFKTTGDFSAFAIVGSKNRENGGKSVLQKDLLKKLEDIAQYTILAETYKGDAKEGVRTADTDAQDGSEKAKSVGDLLKDLSDYTLELGDALNSNDVVFANLYTDENGKFRTDYDNLQNPLKEVMTQDNRIDVTDRTVVVNLIASDPNTGTLELPKIDSALTKDGKLQAVSDKENSEMAGRVIFNVAAIGTGTEGTFKLVPYEGKIVLKDTAVGNYFAPKAEITFEKELTGGVYAKSVTTKKKVTAATLPVEKKEEKQSETAPSAQEEAPAETAAEVEKAIAGAGIETEAVAETETETEIETETETETVTEIETEAETETESEEEQLLMAAADDSKGLAGGAEKETVMVSKKADSGAMLEGAELALYNTKELKPEGGEPIPAGTELCIWESTTENPKDISAWILPDGKYVIRETKTPKDYAKAWDRTYEPETDAETKEIKPASLTMADKAVNTQSADEFPQIAVQDSTDDSGSFLKDIQISIEKTVITTVTDSSGEVIDKKEEKGEGAAFTSEEAYTTIDLASLYTEVVKPTTEGGNTTSVTVTLKIKETSLASGYRYNSVNETEITAAWDEEAGAAKADYTQSEKDGIAKYNDDTDTWQLTFTQKEVEPFTVVSYKKDTTEIVGGTAFTLTGTSGKVLTPGTDYEVQNATVSGNTVSITNKAAVIKLTNEDEIKALSSDTKKYLSVGWVTIPSDYSVSSYIPEPPTLDFKTTESVVYLEKKTVVGTITISSKVRVLSDEKTSNPTNKTETYTFTLFKEDGVTEVSKKTLNISTYNYKASSTVSFDNLKEGVYYLRETDTTEEKERKPAKIKYAHTYLDTDGKWKKASGTQSGNGIKITVQMNDPSSQGATVVDAHKVDFTNIYNQADTLKGSFKIKVRVVDEDNKETPVTLTAGFTVKWTAGGKNWAVNPKPSLSLKDAASVTSKKYTIPFPAGEQPVNVKVRMVSLTDENGNNVAGKYTLVDNEEYTKLNSYQKTIDITKYPTKDGKEGLVTFTLKKAPTKQSVAQLSLTKRVTYQNVPMRVNATYYLGIFTDPAHKKLLFKKALSLRNASSRTSTLKINLYKLKNKSHSITLYFAETDSKGNVVSGGSLSMNSVTLSPTKAEASVVLTNDIIKGSKAARRLTDPNSGFAGDRSALAEAQALTNSDSKSSKKTGDDSPIGRNVALALTSGGLALILAAVLVLRRRRKRRR